MGGWDGGKQVQMEGGTRKCTELMLMYFVQEYQSETMY